jgi:hypothetical protein
MALLVHYKLDGNTNDSSGNNNHATNYGATPISDGKINGSYLFNDTYNVAHSNAALYISTGLSTGTLGQGFSGGNVTKAYPHPGGAGGGAGEAGHDYLNSSTGGAGGDGKNFSISFGAAVGDSGWFAGGGGGGGSTGGAGGNGGGSAGSN